MPLNYYRLHGHAAYDGEPVSQLEHAMQTTTLAQVIHPDDHEFIIAAFLHDIGHLMPTETEEEQMKGYGVMSHELRGAQYLKSQGFSDKICRLVAGHVTAKRYLVTTDTHYYDQLSEASKITLQYQGGLMTPEELATFEADELFALHLQLRRLDEQAKLTDQPPIDMAWMESLIHDHLKTTHQNTPTT